MGINEVAEQLADQGFARQCHIGKVVTVIGHYASHHAVNTLVNRHRP